MTPQRSKGGFGWLVAAAVTLVGGLVLLQGGFLNGSAVPAATTPPTGPTPTLTSGTPTPTATDTPTVTPTPTSTDTSTGTPTVTPTGPAQPTTPSEPRRVVYRVTASASATITYGPLGAGTTVTWPGGDWSEQVLITSFDTTVLLSVEGAGTRTCEIVMDGESVVKRQVDAGVPALCAANTKLGG